VYITHGVNCMQKILLHITIAYQIFMRVSYPGKNSLLAWHQERTVVANCRKGKKRFSSSEARILKHHYVHVPRQEWHQRSGIVNILPLWNFQSKHETVHLMLQFTWTKAIQVWCHGDMRKQGYNTTSSVHIFSYILEQNSSVFIGFGAELVVMVSEWTDW